MDSGLDYKDIWCVIASIELKMLEIEDYIDESKYLKGSYDAMVSIRESLLEIVL